MTRVIGYLRVSTRERADDGFSLAAQRSAIADRADREGRTVEFITDDGYSGNY